MPPGRVGKSNEHMKGGAERYFMTDRPPNFRDRLHVNKQAQVSLSNFTIGSSVSFEREYPSLKDVERSLRINQYLRSSETGVAQRLFVQP